MPVYGKIRPPHSLVALEILVYWLYVALRNTLVPAQRDLKRQRLSLPDDGGAEPGDLQNAVWWGSKAGLQLPFG